MKFPKNLGDWSGLGRTDARRLDNDLGGVWQRKRRGNVEARNKGGYLVVKKSQDAVTVDGYYSLSDGSPAEIRGSTSSYGNFTVRGTAPLSAFRVPLLLNLGNGKAVYGYDLNYTFGGTFDIYGYNVPVSKVSWGITRDGSTLTPRGSVQFAGTADFITPQPGTLRYGIFNFTPGAYSDGAARFSVIYDAVLSPSGEHAIQQTSDDGDNITTTTAALIPGQIIRMRSATRVGPKAMVCLCTAIIPNFQATGWNAAAYPGYFWRYTTDNGVTWRDVVSADITDTESTQLKTIAAGSLPAINRDRANGITDYALMNAVGLTETTALIYMVVPYFFRADPVGSPNTWSGWARVKTGILDLTAGTISELSVRFNGQLNEAYASWERGIFPAPGGGVLLIQNPTTTNANTGFPRIYYTPDGITFTETGVFPIMAGFTGNFSTTSKQRIICPMYDGQFSLFESRDKGGTWKRIGTISPSTTPPPYGGPGTPTALGSFGVVAYLRENGLPVNATPGTPWLSDDRVPYP